MERENNKKRERDQEEWKKDSERNAKKQELTNFDDRDFFTITTDSFRPLGVFDFPWLKENPVSESDDWKFDDEFSCNLLVDTYSVPDGINFPGEVLCETSELVDEFPTRTGEKLEEKSWLSNSDEMDGVDCIWSCVLNQPLSCGSGSRQKEYRVG